MADIDICVEVVWTTAKAVKVYNRDGEQEWLPFSLIRNLVQPIDLQPKDNCIFHIPEWIAYEKGLT